MRPHAVVVHGMAGRTRLRIPSKRGDSAFFAAVAEWLVQHEAVAQVNTNPVTASLLVRHDPAFGMDALATEAREQDWFELAEPEASGNVRDVLSKVDVNRFVQLTRRAPDPRPLMLTVYVGMTLLQVARGQALAPASSLLMYAYQLARDLGTEGDAAPIEDVSESDESR